MKKNRLEMEKLTVETFEATSRADTQLAEALEATGRTSFPNPCIPCTEIGPTCTAAL